MMKELSVAVISGWHPFDVPNFHRLFRGMETLDCFIQDVDNFSCDWGAMRKKYDVLVFYNMNMDTPDPAQGGFVPLVHTALQELGESNQGLVILHHAILAYPQLPLWSDICGIENRGFGYYPDQDVPVQVICPTHPILVGTGDFQIHDETYAMADAGEGSEILLSTSHNPSMRHLAWTRSYRNSRVFCFQCGHDNQAWSQTDFKRILERGILWAGHKL